MLPLLGILVLVLAIGGFILYRSNSATKATKKAEAQVHKASSAVLLSSC